MNHRVIVLYQGMGKAPNLVLWCGLAILRYVTDSVVMKFQGKGKMTTYWLNGERASTQPKFESTPIPARNRNVAVCAMPSDSREAYANAKALNTAMEGSMISSNYSGLRDEADVPLLSITSPPDAHSHA